MDISLRFCLSVLLVSSIRADPGSNDSSEDMQRVPRVSGRIVKVYSGNRPEPYLCNSEGYKADPYSCASFYRCVKERSGKFNVFRYQCAPGTVYDPDIETCNHPRNTRRIECGGMMKSLSETVDTTLANDIYYAQKEIPRPISNELASELSTVEHTTGWTVSSQHIQPTKSNLDIIFHQSPSTSTLSNPDTSKIKEENNYSTTLPWESITVDNLPKITSLPKLTSNSDDICTGDGFTGDTENCRKFYRCIGNQRGGYLRYEFFCSESTVWDEAIQSCNHPWAVKRSKCGRSLTLTESFDTTVPPAAQTSTDPASQITAEYGQKLNNTIQQQLQVSYGLKVTQTQTQISHSNEVIQNQTQINYGERIKGNEVSETKQNQTQIAHGSAVSQTQTQIDYGNNGIQTQLQIDHTKNSSQSQIQTHDITTTRSSTSKQEFTDTNKCSESGFIGDTNDCKKFYRCVDSGRGTFTKYEYYCGDGTVWDQSIEACNHAWAVRECGGQSNNESQTSSTIKTTTYNSVASTTKKSSSQSHYYTSTSETLESNDIGVGYGSPAQSDISTNSTISFTTTTTETSSKHDNTDCSSTGFIGDANDCKKFYRCVDNGRGVFTKHEFKCGEGTVWDPDIEACNHEWAVKKCGGTLNSHKGETTTKTNVPASTSGVYTTVTLIQTTSLFPTKIDDYDMGYGTKDPQTTSTPVKTTKEPHYETSDEPHNAADSNNECIYSGFMGDASNCKKFYRCVDNGMGGYTRYDFSCGEGTLWDPSIEACNHAWAVEKCGGNGNTTESSQTSESFTSPANEEITTSKTTHIDKNTDEPVYTSTISSVLTSPSTESIVNSICNYSGFMGDSNNCKIFYRCVDNGDGSYTRYNFTCGEGTVWDPKIEACNHEWAVEKCGNTIESTSSSYPATTQYPPLHDDIKDGKPTTQSHDAISTTQSLTTTERNDISTSNQECSRGGFVGDKDDCRKFYRCVDNGNGDYDRYEFYCGEGTVWDESISSCNHAWAVKECGTNDNGSPINNENTLESSSATTEKITSITGNPSENEINDGECDSEGFFGSLVDCKKFYRCVDDGNGGFTKYEFSCGEGTTWNSNIQACDHPSSDRPCGQNYLSTTKVTNFNDEIITETTTKLTPTTSSNNEGSNETQKPLLSSGKCEFEGFYGNPSNCKQFFRCVDNGDGGYMKYDFTCGDGTVWNQEIQACDHESDDKQCLNSGFRPTEDGELQLQTTTSSSQLESSTSSTSTSSRPPEIDKTESPASPSGGKCTSEGFFAHPNDCKKFVRCVNNGDGDYTRYEFSCGESTIWVQEIKACDHDNGINKCNQQNEPILRPEDNGSSSTTESSYSSSESQTQKDDVYTTSKKPPNTENDECISEGYFANKNDCRKFYRCVNNGDDSYTKYDFDCAEGTAWDHNIQTCNHMNEVDSCSKNNKEETHTQQTMKDEEVSQTTESLASTTKGTTSSGSGLTEESGSSNESGSGSNDSCTSEGYFGDSKDCNKFYRCVDDGNGGLTKYDFNCGDGTVWDQDLTTCNHPQDVTNPSCKSEGGGGGGGGGEGGVGEENSQTSSSSTTSTTSSPSSLNTTESSSQSSSNCSQEDSSKKPTSSKEITCDKAGYYANPNDCKKFYRCIDWDGDGNRFSVFHFECGEGTIWDPALDTCNHEESVYPPRDCSQTQSQTESSSTAESTTQKQDETTTQESTTSEQTTHESTTSEQSTTQQEQTTTEESTTSEHTTTQQSTTTEQTTSQQSTTSDHTTTQQSTTSETTTQQTTTSELTTTQESTTNEQTTTQQSLTTQQTTTDQSTTSEQTTTQQSTTSEQTTQESTTSEQTTQESTTNEQTTEQASTQKSTTTEQTTTQASQTTTEQVTDQTSEQTEYSTTEGVTESSTTEQPSTTSGDQESTTQSTSSKECPGTEDDQNVFVCPTSFKRHPKYCNMFYQCTEDDDTHEIKIATFKCPNETIYDESQTQCVEEKNTDKKCTGEIARRHRFKRVHRDSQEPITVDNKLLCPAVGYYALEQNVECSNGFLKCERSKSGKLGGYVHQCPEGYLFWSISKRCEHGRNIRDCKRSSNDWKNRWNIPIDRKNVAF